MFFRLEFSLTEELDLTGLRKSILLPLFRKLNLLKSLVGVVEVVVVSFGLELFVIVVVCWGAILTPLFDS